MRHLLAFALISIVLEASALAQGQPSAEPQAPADAPSDDAKKDEARGHFEKGVMLLEEESWEAALAEFLKAREIIPTRATTKNAAICLIKLRRYDEALEMFEALLAFPNVSADDRAMAERAIKDLSKNKVGAIELRGVEPGAAIVIDGRNRGTFPVAGPLRVSAGPRRISVSKEGFLPFEAQVVVTGGQTQVVQVRLGTLTQSGRLRVSEQGGRALDVVVDNAIVGKTPSWEGSLAPGEHTVLLRGDNNLGTQPASISITLNQVTNLSLQAEELASALRVEPVPAGARVAIDAVTVGRGVWDGRLRAGPHRVEVASEGFLSAARPIRIDPGEHQVVRVELERDPSSPLWHKPSRIGVELDGGLAIVPSFGGDVAGGCGGGCSRSVGLGARVVFAGTYELPSGLGVGLEAGYLRVSESVDQRATSVQPVGIAPNKGTVADALRLSGFLVGATAALHFGERFPLLARLGAGALFGSMRDERQGTFTSSTGVGYAANPVSVAPTTTYFFLDPEVRIGFRPLSRLELSVGVDVMVLLALSQPKWDGQLEVGAGPDGIGTYAADALTGTTVVAVSPGLGVRYDF